MPDESRTAERGERLIEVRIRFLANNIAPKRGEIVPTHAQDRGFVSVIANKTHGIKAKKPTPFNSIFELQEAITDLLIERGITLHASRKTRKLFRRHPPEKF